MKKIYVLAILNGICQLFAQTIPIPSYFKEEFDNNANNWNIPLTNILNGKSYLNASSSYSQYYESQHLVNPNKPYSIEASFEIVTNPSGNLDYGLLVGNKFSNGCQFLINVNGQFSIGNRYSDSLKTLVEWTNSAEIKTKISDINILKIVGDGKKQTFFINNKNVYEGLMKHNYHRNGFELRGDGQVAVDYFSINYKADPINIAPNIPNDIKKIKLSAEINSIASELLPLISPDGRKLYTIRQDHSENIGSNKNMQDAWYAEKNNDGSWGLMKNFDFPINNEDNNGVLGVTADNNTLLLQNHYTAEGKALLEKGFSISNRTKDGWDIPQNLIIKNNYNKDPYGEACFSANGKILLLSEKRNETEGARDIYACFLQADDTWSEPMNLGNQLNTFSDDTSPFLAPDGVTLYFASNGWPGYGSRDLFVSKRLDDSWTKWSKPYNLGPNINTTGFDANYTTSASGNQAYLSTKTDETTKEDIYVINFKPEEPLKSPEEKPLLVTELKTVDVSEKVITTTETVIVKPIAPLPKEEHKPDPVALIHGKVLNANTKEPIGAKIAYEHLDNGKEAGIASSNPQTGDYKVILPYGEIYGLHAKASGYISVNENLDLTHTNAYSEIEYFLYLVPIEVGQSIKLNNVFFVQSKPELLPTSYPELDRLAVILADNPSMEIELSGHTDNQGDANLNLQLSKQRVEKVKLYLISKNIKASRITGKGYGGSKPIASNFTPATRKLNRRVEFTITKK